MNCPRCHNKGFIKTEDVQSPLKVLGKEPFDKFNLRRIICVQCGYYFKTEESFSEEIEVKGVKIMELVEDYQQLIKQHKKASNSAIVNRSLFDID